MTIQSPGAASIEGPHLVPMTRAEAIERICELAATMPNGGILPPPEGSTISRADNPWWRNRAKDGGK